MSITTKECPVCKSKDLILLPSLNKKVCTNHRKYVIIGWYLDKDQKPVYG